MTETDTKFSEDRPGYYIFVKETFERNCMNCGKKFKTNMSLNRFCKPACKNEVLSRV